MEKGTLRIREAVSLIRRGRSWRFGGAKVSDKIESGGKLMKIAEPHADRPAGNCYTLLKAAGLLSAVAG